MDVILLGEISSLIDNVNTGVTNIKSVVDTINTNVNTVKTNVATILTNTNTNNTASTTGTISQKVSSAISNTAATTTENSSGTLSAKLTYLINRRQRVVTPSSTNLKALNSSDVTLKVTEKVFGKTVSTSTWTATIKQPGVYRFYATASLTVDTNYSDNTDTASPNTVDLFVTITKSDGTTVTNQYNICSKGAKGSTGSKTITKDIGLSVGESVSCYVRLYAFGIDHACGSVYNDLCTAVVGNVSIRGTANETNGVVS